MRKRLFLFLLIIIISGFLIRPVAAQSSGPVYIVQVGDTLSSIANRFNITLDALTAANPAVDPNLLAVGQQLVIPGIEGISGILSTEVVSLGDSFHTFTRRLQVSAAQLVKLNRLVSPSELYAGSSLIVPVQEEQPALTARASIKTGESLLEVAVKQNSDPWTLAGLNELNGTWDGLPNDILYSKSENNNSDATNLSSAFFGTSITPLPMAQGGTEVIKIQTQPGAVASGNLIDKPLHFFPTSDGLVALQGIHALTQPGIYPLNIELTLPDGSKQSFEQMILVASGNYPKESLSVSNELIDPSVTGPEDANVASLVAPATPAKLWQNTFNVPVYVPQGVQPCIFDGFGTRRSFNGSAYDYFHSGMDFGVCFADHPFDIYAAAPGIVVFAGPLTVRGNATFIDHGWGVYSAYFHQKEIDVAVGQQVQAGELIGQIGATGRVTGPHLHWEVWVNGVQVKPLDWLNQVYP